jgi:hypothetical protein
MPRIASTHPEARGKAWNTFSLTPSEVTNLDWHGVAQVVEHLPSKCEALSSKPITIKKKKKKNN